MLLISCVCNVIKMHFSLRPGLRATDALRKPHSPTGKVDTK